MDEAAVMVERASAVWAEAEVLFQPPARPPVPEALAVAEELARHPACEAGLLALLNHRHPLVVAYALTALQRMNSPALAGLPEEVCARTERFLVNVFGLRTSMHLGGFAKLCRIGAQFRARPGR